MRANPHIIYGDSARRGYFLLDVTPERCTAQLRVLEDPTDRRNGRADRGHVRGRRLAPGGPADRRLKFDTGPTPPRMAAKPGVGSGYTSAYRDANKA